MSRCRVLAVGLLACGLVSVPVAPAAAAKKVVFGKRPLHQGMRGRDVRVLQDYMTRAGSKHYVDGQLGRGYSFDRRIGHEGERTFGSYDQAQKNIEKNLSL